MSTETYAMVRGRVIRVTALESCGSYQDGPIRYGVADCLTRVGVNEIVESGSNEIIRDSEDEPSLHLVREAELIGYTSDIEFIKTDPGILSLLTGIEPVYDWDSLVDIIGFDAVMRVKPKAFALEVWSKLSGVACEGARPYGYTLFPFLKGGLISNFEFGNGTVSFRVVGAQTRANPRWGMGPYDLVEGMTSRLPSPVSRNLAWRNFIYPAAPPSPTQGIVEFDDVIDNGNATNPHPLATGTVEGGSASSTSAGQVEGGSAA